MYLAVSEMVVSAVLFREENKKQMPVFYVSKMLLDAETCYSAIEKMVFVTSPIFDKLLQLESWLYNSQFV